MEDSYGSVRMCVLAALPRDRRYMLTKNDAAALLTFYVQTWDEYHTKTLTLGLISGPVEGIVILITVYAFTAIKGGASFWGQSMLRTVGIPHYAFIPDYVYELPFNEWYMVQGGIVLVLNTVQRYFLAPLQTLAISCRLTAPQLHKCDPSSTSSRRQISWGPARTCSFLRYVDTHSSVPVSQS